MEQERAMMENLKDAGCNQTKIQQIMETYRMGNKKEVLRQIDRCRKKQLEGLHEIQRTIDRLDYLSYHLEKGIKY